MLENDGKVETCGKDFFFGGKIWGRRGKGMESEHGNHEEWKNIFYKSIVLDPIVQFCEVFLIWIVDANKMWKHEVQLYQSKNRRCLMRRGVEFHTT